MTIQDNVLTVFGQCPEGCWHLAVEARYVNLNREINVYVTLDKIGFSIGLHPVEFYDINRALLNGLDIDPLKTILKWIPFNMKYALHCSQNIEPLVADVSKYKESL